MQNKKLDIIGGILAALFSIMLLILIIGLFAPQYHLVSIKIVMILGILALFTGMFTIIFKTFFR